MCSLRAISHSLHGCRARVLPAEEGHGRARAVRGGDEGELPRQERPRRPRRAHHLRRPVRTLRLCSGRQCTSMRAAGIATLSACILSHAGTWMMYGHGCLLLVVVLHVAVSHGRDCVHGGDGVRVLLQVVQPVGVPCGHQVPLRVQPAGLLLPLLLLPAPPLVTL